MLSILSGCGSPGFHESIPPSPTMRCQGLNLGTSTNKAEARDWTTALLSPWVPFGTAMVHIIPSISPANTQELNCSPVWQFGTWWNFRIRSSMISLVTHYVVNNKNHTAGRGPELQAPCLKAGSGSEEEQKSSLIFITSTPNQCELELEPTQDPRSIEPTPRLQGAQCHNLLGFIIKASQFAYRRGKD